MSHLSRFLQGYRAGSPVERRYLSMRILNSFGDGLFLTGSIIYFTRVAGLSATQIGLGLSAAGVVGFAATGLLGFLSDRYGPRRVLIVFNVLQCLAFIAYSQARSFWVFTLIACVISALDFGKSPASAALVRHIGGEADRVAIRARSRTMSNVGICLGSLSASVVLLFHSDLAYYLLILGDGASFGFSAAVVASIPGSVERQAKRKASMPSLAALRNPNIILVTLLNGVMGIHATLVSVLLPLWIVDREHMVGTWMVGVLFILNTVLVIVFQVPVSSKSDTLPGMIAKARLAAILILVASVLLGMSTDFGAALAIVAVVLAGIVLAFAEMSQAASAWAISYELAPIENQGQYLGVFGMSMALQSIVGPVGCAFLVMRLGLTGWLIIGACVVFASILLGPATKRAIESLQVNESIDSTETELQHG
ncbi:MAG: putative rane protein [Actinomycetia bacterium]|nr:putative rane protein [Actinomycetes bacterium]